MLRIYYIYMLLHYTLPKFLSHRNFFSSYSSDAKRVDRRQYKIKQVIDVKL